VSATFVYLIGWAVFLVLLIVAVVAGLWLGGHKR
jgi:hypothetical protein